VIPQLLHAEFKTTTSKLLSEIQSAKIRKIENDQFSDDIKNIGLDKD